MAALSEAARQQIKNGLMRWWSNRGVEVSGFFKSDLYDQGTNTGAVADADDWIDSAQGNTAPDTGYNGALGEPFKSNATPLQKADLLLVLTSVRAADVSGVNLGTYARRIVQEEVD
jgi:hypothetical protein